MQEKAKIQQIPVKVYRTPNRLMVTAPMPGLEPEDIMISVRDDGRMVIQGELRGALKDIKDLLVDEWSVGSYYRELQLPQTVDAVHANVTYGNGVVVVAMPISKQMIAADLTLDKVGTAHGAHAGNAGHS